MCPFYGRLSAYVFVAPPNGCVVFSTGAPAFDGLGFVLGSCSVVGGRSLHLSLMGRPFGGSGLDWCSGCAAFDQLGFLHSVLLMVMPPWAAHSNPASFRVGESLYGLGPCWWLCPCGLPRLARVGTGLDIVLGFIARPWVCWNGIFSGYCRVGRFYASRT